MKNLIKIFMLVSMSSVMLISFESLAFSNTIPDVGSNYDLPEILSGIDYENTEPSIELSKLPWWLAIIDIEIQFGMNVPNCSCCYNGLCSIGRGVIYNYESEQQLADYLNESGKGAIVVNDKNEVYLLVGSTDSSDEYRDGFSLDYLPTIDSNTLNLLASKGVNFTNLKKDFRYTSATAATGYKMIKLN